MPVPNSQKPLPAAAQRYAAALCELAESQKALPAIEDDIKRVERLLGESRDLRRFIASPLLRRGVKAKGLAALLKRAGASELGRHFFEIVARNGRAADIPAILEAFAAVLSERRGELRATAFSARPLKDAQVEAIKSAMLKSFAGKGAKAVRLEPVVDPSLLGGLRLQAGSFVFDGSLKGQLQGLAVQLKGV